MTKVAIITGGASGMGLAVAEALAARGDWELHLLDVNEERGNSAAASVKNAKFHKTDVTSYSSLASVFDSIHKSSKGLDFVFANAGIVERWNFYSQHQVSPPPEPDQLSIDIDFKSVVNTSYLAQHYFRLSPSYKSGSQSLVMTASCGGLYSAPFCPMYSGAKHGVIGFMRSIAKHYWIHDKIRVSCTAPGTVKTNLVDPKGWESFPDDFFTPMEKIVEVVVMLIDGGDMEDSSSPQVSLKKGQDWGQCVEVNGKNHYFRAQHSWCDDKMKAVMEATDVEQLKA
ncbi:NAD(P)-binding protein [Tothia fuscella]|uniref:NAD(P)-binding protein n=1 Tax=Tothia fuscella TaxID=1048955 RepID=A0A9P4NRR0_9PEZI|nr:NAD(P)-binding protein [Tothia fuscella]